jgi:predicted AAA+ superfamily ATPase
MYLKRAAEQPLKDILASNKVGVILGARQVGKTTLAEHVLAGQAAKHNALAGSPAQLFFWRTKAQSEVDLIVQQGSKLRALEVKWTPGRVAGRAFRDAHGVEVEMIRPDNPFAADIRKLMPDPPYGVFLRSWG